MKLAFIFIWGIAFILVAMTGCGTSRDSQTKTVERLQTSTGPVMIDTPIGAFTVQPIRHEMIRSETEVSTEQTRIDAPEVGAIMQAAAGGTPFGAIAGIVGMLGGAAAGMKALQFKRQRDQVIDSVDAGRELLPKELDAEFCKTLAVNQDKQLQDLIKARG